jgi:hypothetical protein
MQYAILLSLSIGIVWLLYNLLLPLKSLYVCDTNAEKETRYIQYGQLLLFQ